MGVAPSPITYIWPSPWSGEQLLEGDVYTQGYRFIPFGGWEAGARPTAIRVTFNVYVPCRVVQYIVDSSNYRISPLIDQIDDMTYTYGVGNSHQVVLNLNFGPWGVPELITTDISYYLARVDLPEGDGQVEVTNIELLFGAINIGTFWTQVVKCRDGD
jgi:hypothetical protein